MLTYTIPLGARDADRPELTATEAADMAQLGFRFSEFRHETGRYRLSPAYKTWHNIDRGTLTFLQDETVQPARTGRLPVAPSTDATELAPSAAATR